MWIIASDVLLHVDMSDAIYVPESNVLRLERAGTCYELVDIPEDALHQVAMGIAEGKSYIEFDNAKLVRGDEDDTSGSIE